MMHKNPTIVLTERAGAEVVECACLIELPDLKVSLLRFQRLA